MFKDIQRILIIKLRAIGDVVLATPVIENLRRWYPDRHIAFLTEHASLDVVEDNPFLDEVIILDRARWNTLPIRDRIRDQLRFYMALRSKRFDLVIDLFGNPRSAILSILTGAPHRVGFAFRGRRHLYNTVVMPRGGEVHEVEFNLDALRAIGVPIQTTAPRFPMTDTRRQEARHWLSTQGIQPNTPVIGMNPGGGWSTKRWTPEGFASVADALIRRYNARVILFWGPGERDLVETVLYAMQERPLFLPETSLKEMGAFLSCCTLFLSNDSGPMHMAAALGIPSIGIFGPTNPALQGPYGPGNRVVRKEGLDCLGCNLVTCSIGNLCMTTLSGDEVLQTVERYFDRDA